MKHTTELLAPAGSYESLRAAVNAGADAVYIGGTRFGARAYADNPQEEELCRAIRFAHLHGCDLYLTVNTLLKDRELEELGSFLRPYYESGLDGVIVQDLGVFSYIRDCFPDLPIHASTQMTVVGADGAALLKRFGASRVVTARELSLEEIRRIHEEVDIEIESFVHGALCYCYSGQCLFSSMLGGRSGNRGRCAQPCRLPYRVNGYGKQLNGRDEAYVLSPKDMCTVEILPELLEAGIDSLKIEGRMKRPEYTAGVVRIYRKYLDYYLEHGSEGYQVSEEDYRELLSLYNRSGFSKGYYYVQNGRSLLSLTRPGHFEEGKKGKNQEKQDYDALLERLNQAYVQGEKKEKIQGIFRISTESPTEFLVRYRGREASVSGAPAQRAKSQPLTRERLLCQLQKTGGTPFVFEKLEITGEENVFLPMGQLNQMRREALDRLGQALSVENMRTAGIKHVERGRKEASERSLSSEPGKVRPRIHIQLEQAEFLSEVLQFKQVSRVYLSSERLEFEKLSSYVQDCHRAGAECALALPVIFRLAARNVFAGKLEDLKKAGLDAVLVRCLDEIEFIRSFDWKIPVVLDHNLYTFNRRAAEFWKEEGRGVRVLHDTLPLELNERELCIRGCEDSELLVYGYLPLMVTAGCLHKTLNQCGRRTELWMLHDRYQKRFPVLNYCRYCYNVIYNCEPLSLLGNRREIERLAPKSLRLSFTIENGEQIARTLGKFLEVYVLGEACEAQKEGFTRGHFKRGVE